MKAGPIRPFVVAQGVLSTESVGNVVPYKASVQILERELPNRLREMSDWTVTINLRGLLQACISQRPRQLGLAVIGFQPECLIHRPSR